MKKLLYVRFIKPPRRTPYFYHPRKCRPLVSYVGQTFIVTEQPTMRQWHTTKKEIWYFEVNFAAVTKKLLRNVILEYDPATFVATYKKQISPYAYWYQQQFGDK